MEADEAKGLASAWVTAASDLDLDVRTEGCALVDMDGHRFPYAVHVANFGSPQGIVIFTRRQYDSAISGLAQEQGYAFSTLGPTYATYERREYVEMLRDWGWCGTGTPPKWYRRKFHP